MGNIMKELSLDCKLSYAGDKKGHTGVWVAGRGELRKMVFEAKGK